MIDLVLRVYRYGELLFSESKEGVELARSVFQSLQDNHMDNDVKYSIGIMISDSVGNI